MNFDAFWLAFAAAAAGCHPAEEAVATREESKRTVGEEGRAAAPARDGDIAIREELEAARRAGTPAAYDLFIARHAGHPLEPVARRERQALAEKRAGARSIDEGE